MKKINSIKDTLIYELQSLKNTRKSIDEYNFNFLNNFYENSRLMHLQVKNKSEKSFFHVSCRQYFIFLVSCWETYFRDIFILCYTKDEILFSKLLEQFKIREKIEDELKINNLEIIDLISKKFNFQNIDSLNEAFSTLLEEQNFLKFIS